MTSPPYRMLRGYTIDPGFSTRLDTVNINETIYRIKWESLHPGPVGEYVEVIDFDPSNNDFYDPVDLNSEEILAQHGLPPSEGNAQFHQQFVYAVVMQTIENFEKALGRKIIWRSYTEWREGRINDTYVQQLRIYPHALREANAYYTPEKVALLFGYFEAGSQIQGSNFPGGAVFTCLSPDIVAHETTHAILDSIYPRYMEDTNPDVAAFHEGFADIVALLQRFANPQLVEHQIAKTRGRLDEYSLLGELATQFGQALETGRGALRGAIGQIDAKTGKWKKIEPDPRAYRENFEAHDRGAILVATIFEAFMRLYIFRIQDLLRIATQGTGILPNGSIHPDLVKRLAVEASAIADHLLSICIRALDYCPPFDITFGTYLRALITADRDICPDENNQYRVALIEAFRAWGIFPDQIRTLSEYSLKWSEPDFSKDQQRAMQLMAESIMEDVRGISRLTDRKTIAAQYSKVQARLHGILTEPQQRESTRWRKYKMTRKIWDGFLEKIGISLTPFEAEYKGVKMNFTKRTPIEVHGIRPAFRIGKDDTQLEQIIISITQSHRVETGPMKGFKFRGGSNIILSIKNNRVKADYIVYKRISSKKRMARQSAYQLEQFSNQSLTASPYYSSRNNLLNFERLHFH